MAERTVVTRVSDVSGESIEDDAGEVFEFAVDGQVYEIDALHSETKDARDALSLLIPHARKIGRTGGQRRANRAATGSRRSGGGSRASADREQNKAVRDWARRQGMEVSNRGRLPDDVAEAYAKAHA